MGRDMFKFKKTTKEAPATQAAIRELCEADDIEVPYDPEMDTIDYLRGLDKKEYEKIIRKTEIYRDADEQVAKLDGKKTAKKSEATEDDYIEQ